jgi:hypothetical protein
MRKRESYLPSAERVQARVAALYSRAMGENAMSQAAGLISLQPRTEAAVNLSSANAREGV